MAEIDVAAFFANRAKVEADCRDRAAQIKGILDQANADTLYPDGLPPALNSLNQIITHYLAVTPAPVPEAPAPEA